MKADYLRLRAERAWPFARSLVIACTLSALTGCVASHSVSCTASRTADAELNTLNCVALWQRNDSQYLSSAAYWLRLLDCTATLTPEQTAAQLHKETRHREPWAQRLRSAWLQSRQPLSLAERRSQLAGLNKDQTAWPYPLRPLFRLWLATQQDRVRQAEQEQAARQQQKKLENALSEARRQQSRLQQQLDSTRRKLKSLTDIEHQLSHRPALMSSPADTPPAARTVAEPLAE